MLLQLGDFAPTSRELLTLVLNFAFAWLSRYWWAVLIVTVVWYMRWYRMFVNLTPDAPVKAVEGMMAHIAALSIDTVLAVFGLIIGVFGAIAWAAPGLLTMFNGVVFFDPVMIASATALLASVGAALGVGFITPQIAIGAAIVLGIVAFVLRSAAARAD